MNIQIEQILQAIRELDKFGYRDYDEHRRKEDKIFAMIETLDKSVGKGLQVGRHIRFQVADGYANYIVVKVLKNIVRVVHLNLLDGYTYQGVYEDDKEQLVLPRKVAEQQIQWEDKLAELFNKPNPHVVWTPLSRI